MTRKLAASILSLATVVLAVLAAPHPSDAGECTLAPDSDLLLAELIGIQKWGTVDAVTGYSFGGTICNVGHGTEPFEADTSNHPVIAQNLYRWDGQRFEQLGASWVKHTFASATQNTCCPCQNPNNPQILGVGCADTYSAGTNGDQAGFNGRSGLGPRSDVNPSTGVFPFPYTTQGASGNAVYKRLQVHNDDLDPALNPGAQYVGELHYVGVADAAAGNGANNAGCREVLVGALFNGGYELSFGSPTVAGEPAIMAWAEFDPGVSIEVVDVPGDGRFILGSRCSDNGDGTWHYEYALYNLNSHLAARALAVPVAAGSTIQSLGFHDVDAHSGELHDSTDWSMTTTGGQAVWSTSLFEDDELANALRWGTMYSFRFDADAPPVTVTATVGLFRPGGPTAVTLTTCGPGPAPLAGDLDASGNVNVVDLLIMLGEWGPCDAPCPPVCPGDIDRDCDVDTADLLALLGGWSR